MHKNKYQILIYKNSSGTCSTFTVRFWFCLLCVALLLASLGGNVYFLRGIQRTADAQNILEQREKELEEQQVQFAHLTQKLSALEEQVNKVSVFNSKLGVMANLHPEHTPTTPFLGGPERSNFSNQPLPAHRQELLIRKMHNFLGQLQTEAKLEEMRQDELMQAMRSNQGFFASTPSIWPTDGWITSSFGYRRSPFTDRREMHKGLDIAGPTGTPIYATGKGTVLSAEKDGAYGLSVTIDHGSGIGTKYAHLQRATVKPDQEVSRGELIGHMGSSGRTTGSHLHYEVRLNGIPVDPMRYILN